MEFKPLEVLEILGQKGARVFSTNDFAKISGKTLVYTNLSLHRLALQGKVSRIEKGKYFLKETSLNEIASNIVRPSYLTALSAFYYYNIITQIPNVAYVASTRYHKSLQVEGSFIKFVKVKRDKFFGFARVGNIFIAEPEKAVVDSLLMRKPQFVFAAEALENGLRKKIINLKKLKDYSKRMRSKILSNRMKKLLESVNSQRG